MPRVVALLNGRDQVGLVARVGNAVAGVHANIAHADQHVDTSHGLFLQRLEIDVEPAELDALQRALDAVASANGLACELHTVRPLRCVLLVSKSGHCGYDLLARAALRELPLQVLAIVSDHDDQRPMAERFGVSFHHLPFDGDRAAQETAVAEAVAGSDPELVVLARYMRILPAGFVEPWFGRMINIHHSFLPAFAGAAPYAQAYERGVKLIGATAHYVTAELDAGPIIAQQTAPVTHRDEIDDLRRKGRDLEVTVLADAVRLHCERRVLVYANRTAVFDS